MNARITRFGVLAIALLLPLLASAAVKFQSDDAQGAFVITEVDGKALCREATADEARALNKRPAVAMHVFGEERKIGTLADEQPKGLNIILRGTDQLEANAQAKAAFERAAAIWESVIADPVTIYVDVDFGPKRFGQDWPSASVIASAGTPSFISDPGDFAEFRNMFLARANSADEVRVYSALPLTAFKTDMGDTSAFGFGINIGRVYGFEDLPAIADPDDERGASSIGFNSAFTYDFNPDDGINFGQKDFVGVVVHEVGHMLGFSSRVGGKETSTRPNDYRVGPAILDFFRFRPGVDMNAFTDGERILTTGGEQIFFAGRGSHGLSTGNPRGENGDNQQASHWKDDGQTGIYVGIMDPTIASARRVELTRYDLEAFDAFGWNIVLPGCTELEPNDEMKDSSAAVFGEPCKGGAGLTEASAVNFKNSAGTLVYIQDFFAVTLPGTAKLNVNLQFTNDKADLNVYLMRADKSIIASAAGTGTTESFETATLDAGTYYVGISSAKDTSTYTLTVTPIGLKPPPPPKPNAPNALKATPASASSIRLQWIDTATNEANFLIERNDGGTFTEIATLAANTTTYDVTGLAADTAYSFRVRARNEGGDSAYTAEASAKTLVAPGACVPGDTTVCLVSDRFRVTVDYLNQFASPPQPGKLRTQRLLAGVQNPDTATFGFGSPQAIEVVVRIQDARPFGLNRFDVYYGGMTDVEYTVTVQDMQTGTTRLYRNPPGMISGGVDRSSFPTDGAATPAYAFVQGESATRAPIVKPSVAPGPCVPGANTACLLNDRFAVKIDYLNQFANPPAPGNMLGVKLLAGVQNPDTAIFGFGSPQAIEAVVRIGDVRPFGVDRFDIYFGGMTDVEYTVTVTDTVTGKVRQYRNPPGAVGGGVDRASFALTN
ncbi:MAG TPA: NF038122 family metalloprotease [Thermoanaerobaculia bacterium]|nr:NF038122 family metalloprotease [Thermoanaerobaculia bacterium]